MPRNQMPFTHALVKTRALALAALLVASAVAACSESAGDGADESVAMAQSDAAGRGAFGLAQEPAPSRVAGYASDATAPGDALPPVTQDSATAPQLLIRTGNVSVRVDSLELAVAAVRRLATSVGGFVGNVSVNTGEYEVRSATLELRVPARRFEDVMAGMSPLGKVEHSSTNVQDIGEEFVDIAARVANAERLEARLVALLANRTGKLEDVLAVERELARVREQIERHEGRLRFLGARVAMIPIGHALFRRRLIHLIDEFFGRFYVLHQQ